MTGKSQPAARHTARRTSCRPGSPCRIESTSYRTYLTPVIVRMVGGAPSGFAPQFLGREARALGERCQLGPHDARVNLARGGKAGKAAIGAGDHILAPDDSGKAADPLGNGLRMLDEIGGMGDDARDQQLAFRQFDILPDAPFVLMPRVGGLE